MSSQCAAIAKSLPRLREAQRAFWLAWRAVQAGDRGRIGEARKTMDILQRAHFDMMRLLNSAWNPEQLATMDVKRNYRVTHRYTLPRDIAHWTELADSRLIVAMGSVLRVLAPKENGLYEQQDKIEVVEYVNSIRIAGHYILVDRDSRRTLFFELKSPGAKVSNLSREVTTPHIPLSVPVFLLSDGRMYYHDNGRSHIVALDSMGMLRDVVEHVPTYGGNLLGVSAGDRVILERWRMEQDSAIEVWQPDADGKFVLQDTIAISSSENIECQLWLDGRLSIFDMDTKCMRIYEQKKDGTFVWDGAETPIPWDMYGDEFEWCGYNRLIRHQDQSVEIWRFVVGEGVVHEQTIEVTENEIWPLSHDRLLTVNELSHDGSHVMRIRKLNEQGAFEVTEEIVQDGLTISVWPRPDGRILAQMEDGGLLVFDGEPVEEKA